MGTGAKHWPRAVGSCLAIQATILATGTLLGIHPTPSVHHPPSLDPSERGKSVQAAILRDATLRDVTLQDVTLRDAIPQDATVR